MESVIGGSELGHDDDDANDDDDDANDDDDDDGDVGGSFLVQQLSNNFTINQTLEAF